MEIQENISLAPFSTMGVGGPALYFVKVSSNEEMQEAFFFAKRKDLPFLVIGKGSNCLFHDLGFHGLAILNKIDFCNELENGYFHVGSGHSFSLLGIHTAKKNFTGLEFASGIPATVGGALYMNAGASGSEISDTLVFVEFMNTEGKTILYEKNALSFSYRKSPFQKMHGAILSAAFQLRSCPKAKEKQGIFIHQKTSTQPYSDKSCGCIFKNPPNKFAGELIEKCGLKGTQVGGAEVSLRHANFIVNKGGATFQDIYHLINLIKKEVLEKEGVFLEEEVRLIPRSPHG